MGHLIKESSEVLYEVKSDRFMKLRDSHGMTRDRDPKTWAI